MSNVRLKPTPRADNIQPMLFPDEAWEAWALGKPEFRRLADHIRRRHPDAAPPGWGSENVSGFRSGEYGGVGVAGVLSTEIK